MSLLRLDKLRARNGRVVSRVEQYGDLLGATIIFDSDRTRNLSEQSVTVERNDAWQLIPFRGKTAAAHVRVTPIGMIDPELLYGRYRIVGRERDLGYCQSPFSGRWQGDDLILFLQHCEFKTTHRVKAYRFRNIPGALTGEAKYVCLNFGDSFELAEKNSD